MHDIDPPDVAPAGARGAFLRDVLDGLSQPQKTLPPKYFYDAQGSDLFEQICRTPEYYPTRTESELLKTVARDLAPQIRPGSILVEFGSGASDKTRLLLDAAPQLAGYVPMDISAAALQPAAARIARSYPHLDVRPVQTDFTHPVSQPELLQAPGVVGFFPGSTIGNFVAADAEALLRRSAALLGPRSLFLVGVDLVKDPAILLKAYDDAQGVTAAFNLNILSRINRELDGDFDLGRFAHRAIWDDQAARIEMHLTSLDDQLVRVGESTFRFAKGETLHTENSHKFTCEGFATMAKTAGWRVEQFWQSPTYAFGEFLLAPA